METWTVGPILPADIQKISRIHCAVLPEGFLAQLGPSVLASIYAAALRAPGAIGLAVRNGPEIGGFLLATTDTRGLFRHVLLRRAFPLVSSLVAVIRRNPKVLRQILESLRYPSRRKVGLGEGPDDAELISIGVLPEHQSKGYAREMILALNKEFSKKGAGSYVVSVYSSNEKAKALYRRMGFEFVREFQMYGKAWTLYRLLLSEPYGERAP